MDEQFDNKLTNHIREVFDNYEHPGVEHGWTQLKQKFPAEEKGNKIAWLWWSGAAAVVLVFLSIGIWYNNQGTVVNNIAVKKQQPAVVKDTAAINNANNAAPLNQKEPVIANNTPVFSSPYANPFPGATGIAPVAKTITALPGNATAMGVIQQPAASAGTPSADQPVMATTVTPSIDSQKFINNAVINQPQIAAAQQPATNRIVQEPAGSLNNNAAAQSAKKTMADMFNESKLLQTAKRNDLDKQENKKVNFSVYAATYFNYAEGSTNQINAGAGFTSDFRLSKNLKLSTGIALAQNSLSYNTAAPQAANNAFAASAPLKQETLFGTAALIPVFKNYNASLVGLDIPINIKYEFNPQKSDAYISAGLSSGTFIDENYTYRYTYSNGSSSAANNQTEQTAHNSFNSFYFGKTLNLSFGLGYPIGNNRLIVEPFVKYPLGGLGAQDIRFGAGGVNLKFGFKTRKK